MNEKSWAIEEAIARENALAKRVEALEKSLRWFLNRRDYLCYDIQREVFTCRFCSAKATMARKINHAPDCPAGEALRLEEEKA